MNEIGIWWRLPVRGLLAALFAVSVTLHGAGAQTDASPAWQQATAGDEDRASSEDDTENFSEGPGENDSRDRPSEDGTPDSDTGSEPDFGGCRFDNRPLQLMV